MSLLDAFDLVIGIDTEYISGENLDGVPYDENAVLSYQAFYFHPATGKSNGGYYVTNGPGRRNRHALTSLISRAVNGALREGVDIHGDWKVDVAKAQAEKPRRKKLKPRNLRVAITAHFTRADLASFSDFKSLKKSFDNVRGTFASVKRPTIREIRMPNGARVKTTLTLFDTRLLAPAGAGKLRDLGNLIGLPKLNVPDVVNEKGETFPGIERMDLVHAHHLAEFEAYAIRDPKVSVTYLRRVAEFAENWGLTKMPPTVANIATTRLRNDAIHLLPGILGRNLTPRGRIGDPIAEARAIQALAADAYHGGRNEAFVHGIFTATPERPFVDYDLRGCYTTAMAGFRTLDWASTEHTTDLSRVAVLEDPTVATVDFEFPEGTRFPCLPVSTGDGGLVYPLSGSTTVTGPELLLAVSLGARIIVRAGVRVPWEEPDIDRAERPFRDFTRFVNRERAAHRKGSVFELLAKECGNSVYGKLGQGVGEMKSIPDNMRLFDTRDGSRRSLPPSVITCPLLAAMTSGLPRAVLSEILSRLPPHVRVLSATTDGWISDATEAENHFAIQGPICQWFSRLRTTVDPLGSPDILEIKHQALSMLVARTRHGITIEPFAGSDYFVARAGHRLTSPAFEYDKGDKAAEAKALAAETAAFVQLQRDRTFDTTAEVTSFISMSKQWEDNSDLLTVHRNVKVALCYDFKRRPVTPVDFDNLIQFQTVPWRTLDEWREARNDFDNWKNSAHAVLKTSDNWREFEAWRPNRRRKSYAVRTPFENAAVTAWAKGQAGFSIRKGKGRRLKADGLAPTKGEVVGLLTAMGVPGVTTDVLKRAARYEEDPTKTVSILHPEDETLFEKLLDHTTAGALESLLENDLCGVKRSKRDQTIFEKTTEEMGCCFLAQDKLVKPIDIAEEIDTAKDSKKEMGCSAVGEEGTTHLNSPRKTAEKVARGEPSMATKSADEAHPRTEKF